MTAERAAYHRLMLLAGLREEYERELDQVLETEAALSDLYLELAMCMSDLDRTVSVLYNYTLEYEVDEQQVFDMVMLTLHRLYAHGQLNATEICESLSKIQQSCSFGEPWIDLYKYLYAYELMTEGILSQKVFEKSFQAVFLRGERIDPWKLQESHNQKGEEL